MSQDKIFPNGFRSWMETHHEVVEAITLRLAMATLTTQKLVDIQRQYGHTGFYDLAEEITDEFEAMNQGRLWDGEFADEILSFTQTKLE